MPTHQNLFGNRGFSQGRNSGTRTSRNDGTKTRDDKNGLALSVGWHPIRNDVFTHFFFQPCQRNSCLISVAGREHRERPSSMLPPCPFKTASSCDSLTPLARCVVVSTNLIFLIPPLGQSTPHSFRGTSQSKLSSISMQIAYKVICGFLFVHKTPAMLQPTTYHLSLFSLPFTETLDNIWDS